MGKVKLSKFLPTRFSPYVTCNLYIMPIRIYFGNSIRSYDVDMFEFKDMNNGK